MVVAGEATNAEDICRLYQEKNMGRSVYLRIHHELQPYSLKPVCLALQPALS
jgi:hypothetical protein